MLKLHGFSVSNYTNMVKQCLLEKGIEFEQIDARPSQEDEFLAKSPMGKIPCLETVDGFLVETSAILDYLEEVHPKPPMYPADSFGKAKAREIIHVTELYIELAARRHLGNAFFGRERSDEATAEVRPQVENGLRAFTQLADFGPWVMGSEFGNAHPKWGQSTFPARPEAANCWLSLTPFPQAADKKNDSLPNSYYGRTALSEYGTDSP